MKAIANQKGLSIIKYFNQYATTLLTPPAEQQKLGSRFTSFSAVCRVISICQQSRYTSISELRMTSSSLIEAVLDLKFFGVYGKVLIFFCHAVRAATNVRAQQGKDATSNWLHDICLVIVTGFGGGILTPLFLGLPSMMMKNNLIVLMSVVSWAIVRFVPGAYEGFMLMPVRMAWGLGHCIFRVFTVANMVHNANTVLPADPYYPIPLMGPIVAGTMTASLGMFLPFSKGLTPIKERTPWPLQGALITAVVYHLVVYDTEGFLGYGMRSILGFTYMEWSGEERKLIIRIMLVIMWVLMQWGQIFYGPHFNIFQPVYNTVYDILGMENPNKRIEEVVSGGNENDKLSPLVVENNSGSSHTPEKLSRRPTTRSVNKGKGKQKKQ